MLLRVLSDSARPTRHNVRRFVRYAQKKRAHRFYRSCVSVEIIYFSSFFIVRFLRCIVAHLQNTPVLNAPTQAAGAARSRSCRQTWDMTHDVLPRCPTLLPNGGAADVVARRIAFCCCQVVLAMEIGPWPVSGSGFFMSSPFGPDVFV